MYYVYILTNGFRTTLYIGITNDLSRRLAEHHESSLTGNGFTGKYKIHHLICFEEFDDVDHAIAREKQLKGLKRDKKEAIIHVVNPEWRFLEYEL